MESIFHANGKQKKAGVAILMLDKIDLKIKKITRDKEGHYIMIKGSVQEEDTTTVNIYAPNRGAPQWEGNRQEGQGSPNGENKLQVPGIFISLKQQEEKTSNIYIHIFSFSIQV